MELAPIGLAPRTRAFYVRTLAVLIEAGIPFLVGGAYALAKHAGIERHTKDLDIFVSIFRSICNANMELLLNKLKRLWIRN